MKEHPILFRPEMVRAILDGRKTQTRRIIKPQPVSRENASLPGHFGTFTKGGWNIEGDAGMRLFLAECPYGQPGDRLWVRETWQAVSLAKDDAWTERVKREGRYREDPQGNPFAFYWKADGNEIAAPWRPSIFLPRWACRLALEVATVRVERLQDISETDVQWEGVKGTAPSGASRDDFKGLWNRIHAKDGFDWNANPWLWVIEFKRLPQ